MTSAPTITIASPSGAQLIIPSGIFIDNQFRASSSGKTFESINPATGKPLCTLALGGAADVELAVSAARKAYNTVWGKKSTPNQRSRLLLKLADLMDDHLDELAQIESLDNGKPVWMARDFDVPDSAACLRYYGGLADKIEGKTIELIEGEKVAYTRIEPLGICGQIIPWNYPIQMASWKLGPALAAGNCVILKPAEQTPLAALKLAELSVQAGFPPGVISVVNGYGAEVGEAISTHMDIQKVAFTGSTTTGRRIMKAAAESNMKKVTLELGGKSPVVVFESADVEQTVNWVCLGILFNQGQDCTAGSRLFVQDTIYDKFMPKLIAAFKAHKIGDPFHEATFQGPQVSKVQQERILSYIESGKNQGAKVEVGGKAWVSDDPRFQNGFFVEPTIFSGCKKGMKIVDEEIFGPVLAVAKFRTEQEAIQLANETQYGLGSGIFSQDASQIQRMVSAIEAGTVWVNNYVALSNSVPFGGMKASGFGRELGVDAVKAYCDVKAIHWNYGETLDWPLPKL